MENKEVLSEGFFVDKKQNITYSAYTEDITNKKGGFEHLYFFQQSPCSYLLFANTKTFLKMITLASTKRKLCFH